MSPDPPIPRAVRGDADPARDGGRVLVFAPYGGDGDLLDELLLGQRIPFVRCRSEAEFGAALDERVDVVVITQEALSPTVVDALAAFGEAQPAWSDVPIVLLADPGAPLALPWRTLTKLDRPLTKGALLSVIRLAREARARQHLVRDLVEELRSSNAHLESRVDARTAELRRHSERLEREIDARERLQNHLRQARLRLAERREQDRLHLARSLHDDIVQRLLALNMALARVERGPGDEPDAPPLDAYRQEVVDIAAETRRLVHELRPVGLDLGLATALAELVRGHEEDAEAPTIHLAVDLPEEPPPQLALCVYRSAQELLRNSLRHADAGRIEIRVRTEATAVKLVVADDGVGFEPPDRLALYGMEDHFGLLGVEEYVRALDGTLEIRTASAGGTTVVVEVPLRAA